MLFEILLERQIGHDLDRVRQTVLPETPSGHHEGVSYLLDPRIPLGNTFEDIVDIVDWELIGRFFSHEH